MWTSADVDRHKKGLSPKGKAKWAKIANAILAATGDDAKAIRIANSKVGR